MEVELTETNGTNVVDASDTRSNPTYIFYYTLSLIWHPTLTTGQHLRNISLFMEHLFFSDNFIFYLFHLRLKEYFLGILPFLALSYMNLHIFLQIRQSRQVTSGRIRDSFYQNVKNGGLALQYFHFFYLYIMTLQTMSKKY